MNEAPEREIRVGRMKNSETGEWISDPSWGVWVDGALHGMCNTEERALEAAAREKAEPETMTERAVRILKTESGIGWMPGVKMIVIEGTGGGCLAAAVYFADRDDGRDPGYIWVTDDSQGYSHDGPYIVGVYDDHDDSQWVDELSGDAETDEQMVKMVRKGVEHLTR